MHDPTRLAKATTVPGVRRLIRLIVVAIVAGVMVYVGTYCAYRLVHTYKSYAGRHVPIENSPETPTPIPVEAVASGERPTAIDDADFYTASDFHHARLVDGTSVCIEGVVNGTGVIFGAPFLRLRCDTCGRFVHCEGNRLDRYQFSVGSNVVVRGSVFAPNMIAETSIVTQEQIDTAFEVSQDAGE